MTSLPLSQPANSVRVSPGLAALLACAAVLIGGGIGVLVVRKLIVPGHRVYTSVSQQTFDQTRRVVIRRGEGPVVLHRLKYVAHNGMANIEWYDGAWSPVAANSGSYVSLSIDGQRVESALEGGDTGRSEARAGSLLWAGRLATGTHDVTVTLDRTDRGFDFPFVRAAA